jgi:hypothetical protein
MEVAIIILTVLLLLREYESYKERQKLLDRIMSKTYSEFKDVETPEENVYDENKTESSIEIEDAREEINGKEED